MLATLEARHRLSPVHSSTVFGPSGAVLILGTNGAGKSTLAYKCVIDLGLQFGSDNFTPTDGERAIGFPGPPKSKPGRPGMEIRPVPHNSQVTAVVAVGWDLPNSLSDRQRAISRFMEREQEAHRGTVWAQTMGITHEVSNQLDRTVADRLAHLPYQSYDWRTQPADEVHYFIKEHCDR